jgi:hypothetical protein
VIHAGNRDRPAENAAELIAFERIGMGGQKSRAFKTEWRTNSNTFPWN